MPTVLGRRVRSTAPRQAVNEQEQLATLRAAAEADPTHTANLIAMHTVPSQPTNGNGNGSHAGISIGQQYPFVRVDAIDALECLAMYDGDVVLAAQQLKTSPQAVMAAVVGDQSSHDLLARYLRAYTMTKTFGVISLLQEKLMDALHDDEIDARTVAKTLTQLVQGMANLTDSAAEPAQDPFTALMKLLPAEEREALKALATNNSDDDEAVA